MTQIRTAYKSMSYGYIDHRIQIAGERRKEMAEHLLTLLRDQYRHKLKRKQDITDTQMSIRMLEQIINQQPTTE